MILLCTVKLGKVIIKLMRFSCYEWNPKRFHPEFNGIASRYSGLKQERVQQQQLRKELQSDHSYTLNLDHLLQRNIEAKMLELSRLQQAKRRHFQEVQMKEQINEERRKQLLSLRERNNKNRADSKKKREAARKDILEMKEESRIKLNHNLSAMNDKLESRLGKKQREKSLKCKLVREEENEGQSKVNNFHRSKNEESLQLYLQRINNEQSIKKEEKKQIKRFTKELHNMSRTVDAKKSYLNEVELEISRLRPVVQQSTDSSKIRRKRVKHTEDSDQGKTKQDWRRHISRLMNPESSSQKEL